ncbi:hypothetical protein [Acidithiobacillus sp.]|uniref:hypothetical protein n=1 Tax=Acidithiobacillus sp. TaxID=1872118 RepID=UPI003D064F38
MANVSFNPALMTQPQNSFQLETQGFIQGLTQDDPVSRMHLLTGIVLAAVTQPVWGGMGVTLATPELATDNRQGLGIGLATADAINGFTVFDQGINFIQTPGNTVPTVQAGMNAPVYAFGSKARVAVPLASGVLSSLAGVSIGTTPLYWDTANFNLTLTSSTTTIALPADVNILAVSENSRTISYNSTTGAVTWLGNQAAALLVL